MLNFFLNLFGNIRTRDDVNFEENKNQPPLKKQKIKGNEQRAAALSATRIDGDRKKLFEKLPDEIIVEILSHCDSGTLNALARTNLSLNQLMTNGEIGSGAVEYNIPFFGQSLIWHEMSNKFSEKAAAQWVEVIRALDSGMLSSQQLKFNHPASNIKEFNKIEGLLNEVNINIILDAIDGYNNLIDARNEDDSYLNLSELSLTRFPLKLLLEDENVKELLLELKNLNLSYNQLSGTIPKELRQLINLKFLNLDCNHFSGSIPPELGQLYNLEYIYIQHNQLSGFIPPELGLLENLRILDFSINQLSGVIPSELGYLIHLESLNLSRNKLTGPIPSELGLLNNLVYLNLYQNQLSGHIPPEFAKLNNLELLNLYQNQLSGRIPFEFGHFINLKYLRLNDNNLSGPVPPQLGFIDNLRDLELYNNQLSGLVPERLAQRFPQLVNIEGHIAGQQAVEEELTGQRRLRPY